MTRLSQSARTCPSSGGTGGDDFSEMPLIQVLFEDDGPAHTAVYVGAELTNRTPAEFAIDAVIAMAEIARWESLGYTVWVRGDNGFAHPLSPAIRGLRPPT